MSLRNERKSQLARLRTRQQQRYDTHRYNLRHRTAVFKTGERVWIWAPVRRRGLSEKLLKRYFGPYRVLRQLSDVTYEVVDDGIVSQRQRNRRPDVVHVVRMKPYLTR